MIRTVVRVANALVDHSIHSVTDESAQLLETQNVVDGGDATHASTLLHMKSHPDYSIHE
jgi:hypothetical protein